MANLGDTFDPNSVDPNSGGFDLLPKDEYDLEFFESSVVPTSNGKGKLLKYTARVLSGPFHGRLVWEQIVIQHESAQAQRIGQERLSAACHAMGFFDHLEDSEQLHGLPFVALVDIKLATKTYPKDSNRISKYLTEPSGAGAALAQPAARPAPAATTAPATRAAPAATKPAPAARPAATAAPAPAPVSTRPPATGARPWGARATAPTA